MAAEAARGLLLDTPVWIWLTGGDRGRFAEDAVTAVERAAAGGAGHVAAISAWEVAMLESEGRLRLGVDCLTWVREALGAPGVRLAIASAYLPA